MPDAEFPTVNEGPRNADPTARTIDTLRRENGSLRELIEARLDGYDKAIAVFRESANQQPTPGIINERLEALKEIVQVRFHELDVRTNAVAASNKNSIDLALQAAKEAASKSENAFNKQIDALASQVNASVGSLETRHNDIKERVTTIEAGGQGSKQSYGVMVTIATLGIAFIGMAAVVISRIAS